MITESDGIDDAQSNSFQSNLGAIGHLQFRINILHVTFDRIGGELEHVGCLIDAVAFAYQTDYIDLTTGQVGFFQRVALVVEVVDQAL